MHILILIVFILAILFGPGYWAKHVISKYNTINEKYAGTGIEFARHIVEYYKLENVDVEVTTQGDHYDPVDKKIRLNEKICGNKSLTSVVIAAHEAGHAIQDFEGYPPLKTRTGMIVKARVAEKIGAWVIMFIPVIALVTRVPASGFLMFFGGLASLGIPVVVHLVTLPVEFDASFKRAMPILSEGGYISKEELPAAKKILTACALTYVAGSLASLLNLWRWLRIIKR